MLSIDLLLTVCLGYVALLFLLAFYVDRRARLGHARWIQSPVIFTLSISVYCTSWTFYGAVGSAARNGLEFITIYLGPTLVFIGWWWLLRKLVRIGRVHRITSIADLISSRYGKSSSIAVLVTLMALLATKTAVGAGSSRSRPCSITLTAAPRCRRSCARTRASNSSTSNGLTR